MNLKNNISVTTKYVRIAPSKIQKLLKKIKGKSYLFALTFLYNIPQKNATFILKTLLSAASNAYNNYRIAKENLYVSCAYVTQGSILKRVHARAKGKSAKIEKKISHITINLSKKI